LEATLIRSSRVISDQTSAGYFLPDKRFIEIYPRLGHPHLGAVCSTRGSLLRYTLSRTWCYRLPVYLTVASLAHLPTLITYTRYEGVGPSRYLSSLAFATDQRASYPSTPSGRMASTPSERTDGFDDSPAGPGDQKK
jgi:hypothetical protein